MRIPKPRGPLSEWVGARLGEATEAAGDAPEATSWDDECLALWGVDA